MPIKSSNIDFNIIPNPPSGYTYIGTNDSGVFTMKLDDGTIVYPAGISSLTELSDVALSGLTSGEALVYDGSYWTNSGITVDLSNYYTKSETYSSGQTDSLIQDEANLRSSGDNSLQNDIDTLESSFNSYTGTTVPSLLGDKLDVSVFDTYTGTTAPNTYTTQSWVSGFTYDKNYIDNKVVDLTGYPDGTILYAESGEITGSTEFKYNGDGVVELGNLTSDNIVIGTGISTTGTQSMIIGTQSGTIAGNSNTVMGWYAGKSTGGGNTSIGAGAGYAAGGGMTSNNVAIGNQALSYASAVSDMVVIGTEAGRTCGVSSGSVYIGRRAGMNASAPYSVYIGYQAGYNNDRSNTLIIENSNDISTPLIYGEFDNDLVKINGDLQSTGDFTVTGSTTFHSGVTVAENLDVTGDVDITGSLKYNTSIQSIGTTTYTLSDNDLNKILEFTTGTTVNLPSGLTSGFQCDIMNISDYTVTLSGTTSTLYTKDDAVEISDKYSGVSVYWNGTRWVAVGNLS